MVIGVGSALQGNLSASPAPPATQPQHTPPPLHTQSVAEHKASWCKFRKQTLQ